VSRSLQAPADKLRGLRLSVAPEKPSMTPHERDAQKAAEGDAAPKKEKKKPKKDAGDEGEGGGEDAME